MANVTATTGVNQFTGTGGGGNTSSNADEILVTAQNQIQSGDLFDGGAGTDTLRLGASLDFTSILNGVTSGIKNLEILRFNGAHTATFRSDQFGAGLLSNTLTLRGTTSDVQTILIYMVSGATTLNMSGLAVQQLDRRDGYHQRGGLDRRRYHTREFAAHAV